jgi:hypothetical protein
MCLEAAKSIPTGELLAYKLIARRKEDGVFVSPIQKSHVWNTNRVVVLDDSPEIWERTLKLVKVLSIHFRKKSYLCIKLYKQ